MSPIFEGDLNVTYEDVAVLYGAEVATRLSASAVIAEVNGPFRDVEQLLSDKLWRKRTFDGVVVPVRFESLSEELEVVVSEALQLMSVSCKRAVVFEEWDGKEKDFVQVTYSDGGFCTSELGRQGGMQILSLGPDCLTVGQIQHLFLHTLGFLHENSRPDRTFYISVNEGAIQPGMEDFLLVTKRMPSGNLWYDFASLLHLTNNAFAREGEKTILTLDGSSIGQREKMSDLDGSRIRLMYRCESGARAVETTCSSDCPCMAGEHGRCEGPSDCKFMTSCKSSTERCELVWSTCSELSPCTIGNGHCTSNTECAEGLVCSESKNTIGIRECISNETQKFSWDFVLLETPTSNPTSKSEEQETPHPTPEHPGTTAPAPTPVQSNPFSLSPSSPGSNQSTTVVSALSTVVVFGVLFVFAFRKRQSLKNLRDRFRRRSAFDPKGSSQVATPTATDEP